MGGIISKKRKKTEEQVDDSQGDDAHSEAVLPEDGLLEKEQHDLQVSNASRATPAQALAVRSKIENILDAKISSAKDLDFLIAGVAEEIIGIEKATQERSSEELEQVLAAQEALDTLMRGNFSSSEELEKALAQTVKDLTGQDGSDGEPANQAKGHRPGMEQWKMRRASAEAGVKLGAALHDAANHPSVMRELDAARVARGSIACLTDEDMSSVLRDEFRPRSASCTHSTLRPRSALSDTAPQDLGYTGGTHMGELPPTIYGQEHLGANGSHASATRPGTRAGGLGREPSREKGGGEEGILRTPSRPSTAARRRAELHAKARVQKLMLQEITDHQQLVLVSRQIRKTNLEIMQEKRKARNQHWETEKIISLQGSRRVLEQRKLYARWEQCVASIKRIQQQIVRIDNKIKLKTETIKFQLARERTLKKNIASREEKNKELLACLRRLSELEAEERAADALLRPELSLNERQEAHKLKTQHEKLTDEAKFDASEAKEEEQEFVEVTEKITAVRQENLTATEDRNKCLAQIDGMREQIRRIFEDCRKLGAENLTLEDLDYEPDSDIESGSWVDSDGNGSFHWRAHDSDDGEEAEGEGEDAEIGTDGSSEKDGDELTHADEAEETVEQTEEEKRDAEVRRLAEARFTMSYTDDEEEQSQVRTSQGFAHSLKSSLKNIFGGMGGVDTTAKPPGARPPKFSEMYGNQNAQAGQERYPKFSEMAAKNATGDQHSSMKKLEEEGKLSMLNASFRASFKNLPGVGGLFTNREAPNIVEGAKEINPLDPAAVRRQKEEAIARLSKDEVLERINQAEVKRLSKLSAEELQQREIRMEVMKSIVAEADDYIQKQAGKQMSRWQQRGSMRNLMVPDSDEESDEGPQGARGSTRNVLARQNSLDEPSGIGKLVQERAGRRAADLAKVQSFSFFEDRADASTPSVNDWRSQRSSGAAKIQLEKEAAMEAAMLQKKMDRELGRQGSLQDLRPDDDPTDDSAKPSLKNLGAKVQAVKAFGSLQKARWSSAPSITGMMSQGESPERAHPKHPDSPESTPEAGNSPGKSPGDCDRVVSFSREGRESRSMGSRKFSRKKTARSETNSNKSGEKKKAISAVQRMIEAQNLAAGKEPDTGGVRSFKALSHSVRGLTGLKLETVEQKRKRLEEAKAEKKS